jgi:hypothetical protein
MLRTYAVVGCGEVKPPRKPFLSAPSGGKEVLGAYGAPNFLSAVGQNRRLRKSYAVILAKRQRGIAPYMINRRSCKRGSMAEMMCAR